MLNPWYFNFVERNDMQLQQLQEEKLLLKITGGSWKFSQGFKLWENMENILRQIASELVCTHSPLTFMHLPITHCWVVINVTILIQEFLCHTTWDGEGFWEVFCIRQVMQNPQVLGGGGGFWSGVLSLLVSLSSYLLLLCPPQWKKRSDKCVITDYS